MHLLRIVDQIAQRVLHAAPTGKHIPWRVVNIAHALKAHGQQIAKQAAQPFDVARIRLSIPKNFNVVQLRDGGGILKLVGILVGNDVVPRVGRERVFLHFHANGAHMVVAHRTKIRH